MAPKVCEPVLPRKLASQPGRDVDPRRAVRHELLSQTPDQRILCGCSHVSKIHFRIWKSSAYLVCEDVFMAPEKWTRERRRELTRTALVESATEVFGRRGFEGASLDEIAENAGFTRGAIYKNFESKEELFFAVMDHFNERALAAFDDQLGGDVEHLDVTALARTWRRTQGEWVKSLDAEFELYALRHPEVRERLHAHRDQTIDRICAFMEEQQLAAHLAMAYPTRLLAEMFFAVTIGIARFADTDQRADELFQVFLELSTASLLSHAESASSEG
jgi:AcrR family transcriptional regulator